MTRTKTRIKIKIKTMMNTKIKPKSSLITELFACMAFAFALLSGLSVSLAEVYQVFLGTRPKAAPCAIYQCTFDSNTGKLTEAVKVPDTEDCRNVFVHGDFLIGAGGKVNAQKKSENVFKGFYFKGDSPQFKNERTADFGAICAMSVLEDGQARYVAGADFPGGQVAIFPINRDGSLGPLSDLVKHEVLPSLGNKDKKGRLKPRNPRAHDVKFLAEHKVLFVADLGHRRVYMYRIDIKDGKLKQLGILDVPDPGARHLAFHAEHKIGYVVNQTGGSVHAFSYDVQSGVMKILKRVSTLPAGYDANNHCADLHVHPSGKWLYASNRGHDSIAVFSLDAKGIPSDNRIIKTGGQSPWSFVISPDGGYVLVSHRTTSDLMVFRINQQNGSLIPTGQAIAVPNPISVAIRKQVQ